MKLRLAQKIALADPDRWHVYDARNRWSVAWRTINRALRKSRRFGPHTTIGRSHYGTIFYRTERHVKLSLLADAADSEEELQKVARDKRNFEQVWRKLFGEKPRWHGSA